MAENWRLLDTGLRAPGQNIALSRALLEARHAEEIASTLRFLRFTPAVLLGDQQSAEQALHLDYCGAHGIDVQRRISGGGAMYCDEAQLGWELYLHRRDVGAMDTGSISRRLCHAVATAVSALGVDARFRARSEIEVEGRAIADTAIAFDGDAVLFQGALRLDADPARLLGALRFPKIEPVEEALAALALRVTSLKALLGRAPEAALARRYIAEAVESEFGVELSESDLTLSEHARYQHALGPIASPEWVHLVTRPASEIAAVEAVHAGAGSALRAAVLLDTAAHVVRAVWFRTDAAVKPRRALPDLEVALRDQPLERIGRRIDGFFAGRPVDMAPLTPADFAAVMRLAAGRPLLVPNA